MKKIYFLFTSGRKRMLKDIENGKSPSEFFYAGPELKQKGYEVEYLEYSDFGYDDKPSKLLFFIKPSLVRTLGKPANIQKLNSADFLVATTNGYGTALAQLKADKKITATVLFLPMGIFELGADSARKEIVRKILSPVISLVISKNETDYLREHFPELINQLHYLSFGVDTNFWKPASSTSSYVFSIGNDSHRDYELLIKAWKSEYPQLRIITKRAISAPIQPNVIVQAGDWRGKLFSDEEIRAMMQNALFGVLPIRDTIQPSGQSACLQMMACGKAVIISRMAGLWDEDGMRDNETCLLPEPGSINAMQKKIEYLLNNPDKISQIGRSATRVVNERFTTEIMANDFDRIIKQYAKS